MLTRPNLDMSGPGTTKGFSLIELLVVIAIIAIVASLLLPSLANSKMKAQQSACLNNVKQMTLAGVMYANDTGEGLPANQPGQPQYDSSTPLNWWDALANYGTASDVRICPSTIGQPPLTIEGQPAAGSANLSWGGWDLQNSQPVSGSFGMNIFLNDLVTPYIFLPATKLAVVFPKPTAVQKPSQTPFFFDENCIDTAPMESDLGATDLYWGTTSPWGLGGGRGMGCCTILRHGGPTASSSVPYVHGRPIPGAINMGFDDGHGELAKLQNLWTYTWHLNWNPAKVKGP